MASPFATFPVTTAQVRNFFVHQYYNLLQLQPEYVHQFYKDASTMMRINGTTGICVRHAGEYFVLISFTPTHSLFNWKGEERRCRQKMGRLDFVYGGRSMAYA